MQEATWDASLTLPPALFSSSCMRLQEYSSVKLPVGWPALDPHGTQALKEQCLYLAASVSSNTAAGQILPVADALADSNARLGWMSSYRQLLTQ